MIKIGTHCMAKISVILFWKVELSPTYSKDLFILMKVDSISLTMKTGLLYYDCWSTLDYYSSSF